MKKYWLILGLAFLLTGCSSQPVMETVADVQAEPVVAQPQKLWVELPENADYPTMAGEDGGQIYFCDPMTVSLQTLAGGDLDRTLQDTTGYRKEELSLIEDYSAQGKVYECAWIAAGEGEMQVCRTRIIDDGSYHYAVTVSVPEKEAGKQQETIGQIMDSARLVDPEFSLDIGS